MSFSGFPTWLIFAFSQLLGHLRVWFLSVLFHPLWVQLSRVNKMQIKFIYLTTFNYVSFSLLYLLFHSDLWHNLFYFKSLVNSSTVYKKWSTIKRNRNFFLQKHFLNIHDIFTKGPNVYIIFLKGIYLKIKIPWALSLCVCLGVCIHLSMPMNIPMCTRG